MNPLLAVPAILLLVHRAWSRQSLTPLGLVAAAGTAVIHALHPSLVPFALLVVFYLAGTKATKVLVPPPSHDKYYQPIISSQPGSQAARQPGSQAAANGEHRSTMPRKRG
jgi:hypothetical protein